MRSDDFRTRLLARERLAGIWANLNGCVPVEILSTAPGLDWVGIDCEHVPYTIDKVLEQLRAAQAGHATTVVRTAGHDPVHIAALLDIGVAHLIVPHVDTAEQARAVVGHTRYPPEGGRGYASGTRACAYGRHKAYASGANNAVCLVVMAETVTALRQLEDIARVPGVDAIYIGAADLAADMGLMGQPAHPLVRAEIEAAIRTIVDAGGVAGISVQSAALCTAYTGLGASFLSIGQDVHLFSDAVDRQIKTILQ
jgi:4-hydroxy-2-oxoheptanedioate aldolase